MGAIVEKAKAEAKVLIEEARKKEKAIKLIPSFLKPYLGLVVVQPESFWLLFKKEQGYNVPSFSIPEAMALGLGLPNLKKIACFRSSRGTGFYSLPHDKEGVKVFEEEGVACITTDIRHKAEMWFECEIRGHKLRAVFELGQVAHLFREIRSTVHQGRTFFSPAESVWVPGTRYIIWHQVSREYPAKTTHLVYDPDKFLAHLRGSDHEI